MYLEAAAQGLEEKEVRETMSDLLFCPFCGGEAEMLTAESMNGGYLFGIMCNDCRSRGDVYDTEAEAIAAWNARAAYEMEGWFYLPKPKQRLFDYTTGFSFDDVSLKATGTVGVYAFVDAVRKWQEEELNQHIIERICEVFKPERTCDYKQAAEYWQRMYEETFAERTCRSTTDDSAWCFVCSECGKSFPRRQLHLAHNHGEINYCPNCGARVVE